MKQIIALLLALLVHGSALGQTELRYQIGDATEVGANGEKEITVECPQGQVAISGGWNGQPDIYASESYPNTSSATMGRQWFFQFKNTHQSLTKTVTAYVVCLVDGAVSVNKVSEIPPSEFQGLRLDQNYPNPFSPTTTIEYSLETRGSVRIEVLDLTGRLVSTLVDGTVEAGDYTLVWNGAGLSSGTYFYRIVKDEAQETKKMILRR